MMTDFQSLAGAVGLIWGVYAVVRCIDIVKRWRRKK